MQHKRYIFIADETVCKWDDDLTKLKSRIEASGHIYELKYTVDVPIPVPTLTEVRHPQVIPGFSDDDIPF